MQLTNADFSGAILENAVIWDASLTGANFQGARVSGATFYNSTSRGFTKEQLYSTASYQQRNLRGTYLGANDLTGWNFRGQDLANARFNGSTLANADFSAAELRLALGFNPLASTLVQNTIRPDGEIRGLDLTAGSALTVRDLELGIHVTESFTIDATGVLDLLLQDPNWGSTIALGQTIAPQLGGTCGSNLPRALIRSNFSTNNLTCSTGPNLSLRAIASPLSCFPRKECGT